MRYEMPGSLATNALILSLFVHALLVTLFIISLNPIKRFTPKILTVKIVSTTMSQSTVTSPPTTSSSKKNSDQSSRRLNYDIVEESLYAIKAKKRIEKIVRLRTEIRTLQSNSESLLINHKSRIMAKEGSEVGAGLVPATEISNYGKTVEEIIKSNWSYPEAAKKGLTSTVVVSVQTDGSIKIVEFKSSGERLFDYSVRNAILKSSPLPRPVEPIEIEMRFRND